ncbi:MAG: hypothetical protein ABJE66_04695 [Deltaproteobacteria bacterium]
MKSVAIALSLSLAACYGAAPPKPVHVTLPMLENDAEIGVFSESKTTIEQVARQASTCPEGKSEGDPSCVVTKYTSAEPVTRTTTTATYANAPITYAQFKVLTDPHWDQKLSDLDDLAHKCQRANIPRYAGLGLMLGGLIGGYIVGAASGSAGAEMGVMYGGAGLGAASYALGYFAFGGRQCNEARSLFNELDMSAAVSWNTVEGDDYAIQMKSLAEQFNAGHRNGPTAHLDMRR